MTRISICILGPSIIHSYHLVVVLNDCKILLKWYMKGDKIFRRKVKGCVITFYSYWKYFKIFSKLVQRFLGFFEKYIMV